MLIATRRGLNLTFLVGLIGLQRHCVNFVSFRLAFSPFYFFSQEVPKKRTTFFGRSTKSSSRKTPNGKIPTTMTSSSTNKAASPANSNTTSAPLVRMRCLFLARMLSWFGSWKMKEVVHPSTFFLLFFLSFVGSLSGKVDDRRSRGFAEFAVIVWLFVRLRPRPNVARSRDRPQQPQHRSQSPGWPQAPDQPQLEQPRPRRAVRANGWGRWRELRPSGVREHHSLIFFVASFLCVCSFSALFNRLCTLL